MTIRTGSPGQRRSPPTAPRGASTTSRSTPSCSPRPPRRPRRCSPPRRRTPPGCWRTMDHAGVVLVTLAVADWPERLRGRSGYLVPKPVQRTVTAASFGSQKWAHWQGGDGEVLRVSLGRDGLPVDDLDDDALVAPRRRRGRPPPRPRPAADGGPGHPLAGAVPAVPPAPPATGSPRVDAALPAGLFVTGASYRGIGVPACIAQARAHRRRRRRPPRRDDGPAIALGDVGSTDLRAAQTRRCRRWQTWRDAPVGDRGRGGASWPRRAPPTSTPTAGAGPTTTTVAADRRRRRHDVDRDDHDDDHDHVDDDDAPRRRSPTTTHRCRRCRCPIAAAAGGRLDRAARRGRLDRDPRIGLTRTMFEGIRLSTLDHGPGHWPGTAMPGELGNVVVAGHRSATTPTSATSTSWCPATRSSCRPRTGRHVYRVRVAPRSSRPTRSGSSTRPTARPPRCSPATRRARSASASSSTSNCAT